MLHTEVSGHDTGGETQRRRHGSCCHPPDHCHGESQPWALLCWGREEPMWRPAPPPTPTPPPKKKEKKASGLSPELQLGTALFPREGGVQEAVCPPSLCCGGSCLPAGQLPLPASTMGTQLGAGLCPSLHGKEGEGWGRWDLSYPTCMAIA